MDFLPGQEYIDIRQPPFFFLSDWQINLHQFFLSKCLKIHFRVHCGFEVDARNRHKVNIVHIFVHNPKTTSHTALKQFILTISDKFSPQSCNF